MGRALTDVNFLKIDRKIAVPALVYIHAHVSPCSCPDERNGPDELGGHLEQKTKLRRSNLSKFPISKNTYKASLTTKG